MVTCSEKRYMYTLMNWNCAGVGGLVGKWWMYWPGATVLEFEWAQQQAARSRLPPMLQAPLLHNTNTESPECHWCYKNLCDSLHQTLDSHEPSIKPTSNQSLLFVTWLTIYFFSLTTNNTHSKPIAHNEEAVINYMHQNHKKLIIYSTRHDCTATCHDVSR